MYEKYNIVLDYILKNILSRAMFNEIFKNLIRKWGILCNFMFFE